MEIGKDKNKRIEVILRKSFHVFDPNLILAINRTVFLCLVTITFLNLQSFSKVRLPVMLAALAISFVVIHVILNIFLLFFSVIIKSRVKGKMNQIRDLISNNPESAIAVKVEPLSAIGRVIYFLTGNCLRKGFDAEKRSYDFVYFLDPDKTFNAYVFRLNSQPRAFIAIHERDFLYLKENLKQVRVAQ